MKKLVSVLSIILLAAILLSACASGSTASVPENSPAPQAGTAAPPASASASNTGGSFQWASHPIASLAPQPVNSIAEVRTDTSDLLVLVLAWGLDDAIAYSETAESAGFDQKVNVLDTEGNYVFQAKNKDDVYISVDYIIMEGDDSPASKITIYTNSEY